MRKGKIREIREKGLDTKLFKKYYRKYQEAYKRRRLDAIKLAYKYDTYKQICSHLECSPTTLVEWFDLYLDRGFDGLMEDIQRPKKERLNIGQKQQLEAMIIDKKPIDYGIEGYIWTAKGINILIRKIFNVEYKDSSIYDLLGRMGLSHQKAHRDYANADAAEQKQFMQDLKKNYRPKAN